MAKVNINGGGDDNENDNDNNHKEIAIKHAKGNIMSRMKWTRQCYDV